MFYSSKRIGREKSKIPVNIMLRFLIFRYNSHHKTEGRIRITFGFF